jgi:hypothetical protein
MKIPGRRVAKKVWTFALKLGTSMFTHLISNREMIVVSLPLEQMAHYCGASPMRVALSWTGLE